ncbi:MAG: hypothetical protein ACREN7_01150 [Candidatus Dormibacteria bacterium]
MSTPPVVASGHTFWFCYQGVQSGEGDRLMDELVATFERFSGH